MSIDNGTCQLCFPLRGEVPTGDLLVLRDVDVVGVGALRRHQIEGIQRTRALILETHENSIPNSVFAIYQAELLRTLQWLRPLKIVHDSRFDFLSEQRDLFSRIFPKTEKALGIMAAKMRDLYLAEVEWASWLLQDHWRYFAGFLRQRFPENTGLLHLVHWEWVQAWLEIQPFVFSTPEPGTVLLNPSLQIVSLTEKVSELNRDKGLYAFVYSDKKATVVERSLDVFDAQFLDLLQEDRKYTSSQLIQMVDLSGKLATQLSPGEWEKKFLSLCEDSIIVGVGAYG